MADRTIFITDTDLTRLRDLLAETKAHRREGFEYLRALERELDHARVVAAAAIPPTVVTMRSTAQIRDLRSRQPATYTLVFPEEANFDEGRISVLAPLGTAMLGCAQGQEVEWAVPAGTRRFKIERVLYQPEAAGHYHL